jgi:site-specific recombinase XerD
MEAAEIPDPPSPHGARRTTASLLGEAGVPPHTIRSILGHSTIQQTGEYVDVSREQLEGAVLRLARLQTEGRVLSPS